MDGKFLPEADWRDLLREIHNHQVIPIVGPEMVTVPEPSTGISIPLYRALAPKLAAALAVPTNGPPATSLNRVACDHLLSGGARKAIYGEVAELLDRMELTPPQALCELASITDFDLFISGTIDPLLAVALEGARPGFQRREHVRAYDYKRFSARSREQHPARFCPPEFRETPVGEAFGPASTLKILPDKPYSARPSGSASFPQR